LPAPVSRDGGDIQLRHVESGSMAPH